MRKRKWYRVINITLALTLVLGGMPAYFGFPQPVSATDRLAENTPSLPLEVPRPALAADSNVNMLTAGRAPGDALSSEGTNGGLLQFTSAGHVLGFSEGGVIVASLRHMLRTDFLDARVVSPEADGEVSGESSAGAVPPLGRVTYRNLWDGVTVVYEASEGAIAKSTYYIDTTEEGVPVDLIRLGYNRSVQIDEEGNLLIIYEDGTMVEGAPVAWQETEDGRKPVTAAYDLRGEGEVGFSLGDYTPGIPVVIDPVMTWNTFLGGSGTDYGYAIAVSPTPWNSFVGGSGTDSIRGIAVDGSGNVYVSGTSNVTWGSPVRVYTSSAQDAFAAKLDSSGNLTWNTFLGGSGFETGAGIAVDGSGNVYVGGRSDATWGSPVQTYNGSGEDAYAAKLDLNGNLTWNTFLGGSGTDRVQGIAIDGSGNVYVGGRSNVTWESPVRAHYGSGYDAFAAKLDLNGNLTWNTFLGGSGTDYGYTIVVDGSGNVYVGGESSDNWSSPVRGHYGSGKDTFAAKLDLNGNLTWNTFLGGSGTDRGDGIAVDDSGNVYVGGRSSANWSSPVRAYQGGDDAFAAKLDSSGNLTWNTFLGSGGTDRGIEIAVDGSGNVYVGGYSDITWGSPVRAYPPSTYNAFAAKLDSSGNLTWNTFLGGTYIDYGYAIAVDGSGNVYAGGRSAGTWESPVQAHYGSGYDAFAARLDLDGNLVGSADVYVSGYSTAAWEETPVRDYTSSAQDAFAARLDSSGNLIWHTFLGGGGYDSGFGIAVDGIGNVYVGGFSGGSWGSPVRNHTLADDAFAAKLDSSGNLTWNTFLGGSATDAGYAIAVDGSGNVYVAGRSLAAWVETPVRGYTPAGTSAQDAFAAKLDSSGNLTWHTFLGGNGGDSGFGIAVGSSGNVYVTGRSDADWVEDPVRGYTPAGTSPRDAFAAKLDSSGNLTWHTFLGDSGWDQGDSIAVDSSGNVYVGGYSNITWGSPVRVHTSGFDAYAARLDSSGNLTWNTFLGGSSQDLGYAIAVDGSGNVYVGGRSGATWGSPVRDHTSGFDAYAARLDSSGNLTWNTFLGGSGGDEGHGIAVDSTGNVYVSGSSNVTWGSPVRAYDSGNDAFVAKLGNMALVVGVVALYESNRITAATSMTPQVEYVVKVTITDLDQLSDLSTVTVTLYYDADGTYSAGEVPGAGNTQTAAILTLTVGGTPVWAIDPSASTSWTIEGGSSTQPTLTNTTDDFWFHFKPGKVATETVAPAKWHIHAVADDGMDTAAGYQDNRGMNWYGEITVNTGSITWGTLSPGTDFAEPSKQTGISVSYIANGAYDKQVASSGSWTGNPSGTATLNAGGSPGTNQFSIRADDTATLGSAVLVTEWTTFVTIDDTGVQTGESGDTIATNTVWLKLGTPFSVAAYSGSIYYKIIDGS